MVYLITFWTLINFSRKMPSNVSFMSPSCFLKFLFSSFICKRSLDNPLDNLLDSSTSFDKVITSSRTTNSMTVKTKPTTMWLHLQNLLKGEDISSRSPVMSLRFSSSRILFRPLSSIAQGIWTSLDVIQLDLSSQPLSVHVTAVYDVYLWDGISRGSGFHFENFLRRNVNLKHFSELCDKWWVMQNAFVYTLAKLAAWRQNIFHLIKPFSCFWRRLPNNDQVQTLVFETW